MAKNYILFRNCQGTDSNYNNGLQVSTSLANIKISISFQIGRNVVSQSNTLYNIIYIKALEIIQIILSPIPSRDMIS